jgi:hypothetical protein
MNVCGADAVWKGRAKGIGQECGFGIEFCPGSI